MMAFGLFYAAVVIFFQILSISQKASCSNSEYTPYLETYPSDELVNGTSIHFALILSFPGGQFDSYGAIAGVRVALDRINSDPYLLQNYTLRYTLTNSSVSSSYITLFFILSCKERL